MASDGARPDANEIRQLVERAQAGDREAFEGLYREHAGRIYALCLRMAGDPREAEELMQDAFVRAWEKLGGFHGRSAFGTWLHRLTVNVVLGTWRRRGRRREKVVALERIDDGERADVFAAPGHGRSTRTAIDLERAIARLPAGARNVFVLHEIEGLRHREIADLTGIAVGTCKAQLHRARRLLRESLTR